jgi:hypothetical protein
MHRWSCGYEGRRTGSRRRRKEQQDLEGYVGVSSESAVAEKVAKDPEAKRSYINAILVAIVGDTSPNLFVSLGALKRTASPRYVPKWVSDPPRWRNVLNSA